MGEEFGTHGGSGEVHPGVLWKQLRKRDYMGDLGANGEDNIKTFLKGIGWEGVDWNDLAQGRTSVQLLSTRQWIFSFHKIQGVF